MLILPFETKDALKSIVDFLIKEMWPKLTATKESLLAHETAFQHLINIGNNFKIKESFVLYCNQLKQCMLDLFSMLKLEFQNHIILQESRYCILERLSSCVKMLERIQNILSKQLSENLNELSDDFAVLENPMYFVNWIDNTFEVLNSLSDLIYRTDSKGLANSLDTWKTELIGCIQSLHTCVDELLLSAMTLCKYTLPKDQPAVTARCQVVLREVKALINELVDADLNNAYRVTKDSLKLPIKPSNVNVLIDVLKDALYILETNTNNALLALLIFCSTSTISPVDIIKNHFEKSVKGICTCDVNNLEEVTENCQFIKEFDLYNERLLQIGHFAVSCSSDSYSQSSTLEHLIHYRKPCFTGCSVGKFVTKEFNEQVKVYLMLHFRWCLFAGILSLRSALMNLEAHDPYVVPALAISPHSLHSSFLIDMWKKEVRQITSNVYLIVDPMAFTQKCKENVHATLLGILKDNIYDNAAACSVINIGCLLYDFFDVYNQNEPDALVHVDSLLSLMKDLIKVVNECKIMSNILSSGEQDYFKYEMKITVSAKNDITNAKFCKRLKLLYTLITRIDDLFHSKENDDQLFNSDDGETSANVTHTIYPKVYGTYIKNTTGKFKNNVTRSTFARNSKKQFALKNLPLSKQTENMKGNIKEQLSFSVQIDELFNNITSDVNKNNTMEKVNNDVKSVSCGIVSKKDRSSLRKVVLLKHKDKAFTGQGRSITSNQTTESETFMDSKTTLQITEILDQINDISTALSKTSTAFNITRSVSTVRANKFIKTLIPNILKLNINESNGTVSKHIWNIPIKSDAAEVSLDNSSTYCSTNVSNASSQPSDVTTLERINDLDLLENRLNCLKSLQSETDV